MIDRCQNTINTGLTSDNKQKRCENHDYYIDINISTGVFLYMLTIVFLILIVRDFLLFVRPGVRLETVLARPDL